MKSRARTDPSPRTISAILFSSVLLSGCYLNDEGLSNKVNTLLGSVLVYLVVSTAWVQRLQGWWARRHASSMQQANVQITRPLLLLIFPGAHIIYVIFFVFPQLPPSYWLTYLSDEVLFLYTIATAHTTVSVILWRLMRSAPPVVLASLATPITMIPILTIFDYKNDDFFAQWVIMVGLFGVGPILWSFLFVWGHNRRARRARALEE